MNAQKKILVLGIGNDILGDDAVGLVAARKLKKETPGDVDVVESCGLGLDLLDRLEGYDCALLLDAVMTGQCRPGTVLEFAENDFAQEMSTSPHYAGLPEIFRVAERLQIPFPKEIRVLALEVEDPYEIHEGLTVSTERSIPDFVNKAKEILTGWKNEPLIETIID